MLYDVISLPLTDWVQIIQLSRLKQMHVKRLFRTREVSISHDLSWEKHCYKITKKANKTLGLLRRTLPLCSKEVKSRAYQALVRPQLEYAAAWNPCNITTADRLEHIQCAATRFVHHDYRSCG